MKKQLIYFALTISPSLNPKHCTVEDLDWIEEKIGCRAIVYDLHDKVYEQTSNGYLHMHALITMNRHQYRIPLTQHPGFSVRIEPIINQCMNIGWYTYMNKEYESLVTDYDKDERQLEIITNAYLQILRFH